MRSVACDNGVLTELARGGWGQLTLRTVLPGCEAGGHRHPNTDEWWVVVGGRATAELRHPGLSVPVVYHLDGAWPVLVRVPAGAWHSIRCEGDQEAVLLFWANRVFEEQEKAE